MGSAEGCPVQFRSGVKLQICETVHQEFPELCLGGEVIEFKIDLGFVR